MNHQDQNRNQSTQHTSHQPPRIRSSTAPPRPPNMRSQRQHLRLHQRRLVMHRPRIEHLPEMGHRRLVDVSPVWVDLCQAIQARHRVAEKVSRSAEKSLGRVDGCKKKTNLELGDVPILDLRIRRVIRPRHIHTLNYTAHTKYRPSPRQHHSQNPTSSQSQTTTHHDETDSTVPSTYTA